jgi:hypothetical protein
MKKRWTVVMQHDRSCKTHAWVDHPLHRFPNFNTLKQCQAAIAATMNQYECVEVCWVEEE